MANRPCKPDADVKRIWQLLMPDTAFPACGTAQAAGDDGQENATPANEPRTQAEAPPDTPRARRG
jgi:hypothetical protein